jgi:hypothetical protein
MKAILKLKQFDEWSYDMEMNAQAIFTVFYAILYGAIFTISDKWRPFTYAGYKNHKGRKRICLSTLMLLLLPIIYFIVCFLALVNACKIGSFSQAMLRYFLETGYDSVIECFSQGVTIGITIFLVSPVYALFSLWATRVSSCKDKYYSQQEQLKPPVRDSLSWVVVTVPSSRLGYVRDFCLIAVSLFIIYVIR